MFTARYSCESCQYSFLYLYKLVIPKNFYYLRCAVLQLCSYRECVMIAADAMLWLQKTFFYEHNKNVIKNGRYANYRKRYTLQKFLHRLV